MPSVPPSPRAAPASALIYTLVQAEEARHHATLTSIAENSDCRARALLAELATREETIARLVRGFQRHSQSATDRQHLQERYEAGVTAFDGLKGEKQELESQLGKERKYAATLDSKVTGLEAEVIGLKEAAARNVKEAVDLRTEKITLEARLLEERNSGCALAEQLDEKQTEITTHASSIAALKVDIQNWQKYGGDWAEKAARSALDINAVKTDLSAQTAARASLQDELKETQRAYDHIAKRHERRRKEADKHALALRLVKAERDVVRLRFERSVQRSQARTVLLRLALRVAASRRAKIEAQRRELVELMDRSNDQASFLCRADARLRDLLHGLAADVNELGYSRQLGMEVVAVSSETDVLASVEYEGGVALLEPAAEGDGVDGAVGSEHAIVIAASDGVERDESSRDGSGSSETAAPDGSANTTSTPPTTPNQPGGDTKEIVPASAEGSRPQTDHSSAPLTQHTIPPPSDPVTNTEHTPPHTPPTPVLPNPSNSSPPSPTSPHINMSLRRPSQPHSGPSPSEVTPQSRRSESPCANEAEHDRPLRSPLQQFHRPSHSDVDPYPMRGGSSTPYGPPTAPRGRKRPASVACFEDQYVRRSKWYRRDPGWYPRY